jgi:hypothetical protein
MFHYLSPNGWAINRPGHRRTPRPHHALSRCLKATASTLGRTFERYVMSLHTPACAEYFLFIVTVLRQSRSRYDCKLSRQKGFQAGYYGHHEIQDQRPGERGGRVLGVARGSRDAAHMFHWSLSSIGS